MDKIHLQFSHAYPVSRWTKWLQPQVVLDQRECRLCQCTINEVLVQWKYTTPVDATYEPATIQQQFLHLKP
jgi:hypothetical protein